MDPTAPPVLRDLITDLRALADRRFASLRELERAAHVSRSTLSEAFSGRRLPSLDVVLAIARTCEADEKTWRDNWNDTRVALEESDEPMVENTPVRQPLADSDPRRVGPFRIRGVLASGSVGQVYLAYTPGGRPVAVKVVHAEFAADAEFRRRFRREIEAARRVHDLFTAPVLEADADAPRPWLATAYVPGPSLKQAVSEHGPLPMESVETLAGGICEALRAVHAAGIVHRDLNAGNVLLADDGPKVIDFGIAYAAETSHQLTRTGARLGTAAFMSPEQATGDPVGPPADVFALGALLTYAATGRPPFGEGPAEAILYRIVHESPDLDSIPDDRLRELAAACLAKDPAGRPTPDELLRRLNGATEVLPEVWLPPAVLADVVARKAPPRSSRSFRRLPTRLALAGVGVAAAAVLTASVVTDIGVPRESASGITPPVETHQPVPSTSLASTAPVDPGPPSPSPAPPQSPGQGVSPGQPRTSNPAAGGSAGTGGGGGGGQVPAPGAGAPAQKPLARMNFENGNDDWVAYYGGSQLSLYRTTQVAYDGAYSLHVTASPGSEGKAIGADELSGVHAGTVVTMHIWYGGEGQGTIKPFVQDTSYDNHFAGGNLTLRNTGWNTVAFTVPSVSVKAIGFQLDVSGGSDLVVDLDAVNW